jgi:2-methylcitrate dehydratase PrpD
VTAARELGEWVAGLRFEDLPQTVVASVRARVCDTLGVAIAAHNTAAARAARAVATRVGGAEEARLVGESRLLPASSAALVNGTCAHALDFDDTHLPSVAHPSAPLVPTVLAQAEASGSNGRDAVTSLVAAYETYVRIALAQYDPAGRNSVMFERGLHATSIVGAVAGAAACAKLLGLDGENVAHAIAVACSMGSGLIEANRSGGTVKPLHCGWAGHAAVMAAALVEAGLTGPPTVLEGRFGLLQAYCGSRGRPDELVRDLGREWHTPEISYKPYPCNHFTHAIVDAALALKADGLHHGNVQRVEIGTAEASLRTIGEPLEEKQRPRTPYHAAFSAPFVFATALVGGSGLGVSGADFTAETLADPARARISEVTTVVADEQCTEQFPERFGAVVRVETRGGDMLERRVPTSRGGPGRSLSDDELFAKLEQTAGDLAPTLSAVCRRLEQLPDVGEVLAATNGAAAPIDARAS